jgi:hypothetical protein
MKGGREGGREGGSRLPTKEGSRQHPQLRLLTAMDDSRRRFAELAMRYTGNTDSAPAHVQVAVALVGGDDKHRQTAVDNPRTEQEGGHRVPQLQPVHVQQTHVVTRVRVKEVERGGAPHDGQRPCEAHARSSQQ